MKSLKNKYCKHYQKGNCNLGDKCGFIHEDCVYGDKCKDPYCKKGHFKNKNNTELNLINIEKNKNFINKKEKQEKDTDKIHSLSPIIFDNRKNSCSPIDTNFKFPRPSPRENGEIIRNFKNLLNIDDLTENIINTSRSEKRNSFDKEIILSNFSNNPYFHESLIFKSPKNEEVNNDLNFIKGY